MAFSDKADSLPSQDTQNLAEQGRVFVEADHTTGAILKRLGDTENYPDETLEPYVEFLVGGNLYYVTPGGFLHQREDPGMKEVSGVFCGHLANEAWHYTAAYE